MKKFLFLFLLLLVALLFLWLYPSATPAFSTAALLFSLAIAISAIFKKHKQAENPRPKIAKDIVILILTLLLIIFLGLLAGTFANHYLSPRFGVVVGFVTAMAASFAVGYFVKKGAGKIFG